MRDNDDQLQTDLSALLAHLQNARESCARARKLIGETNLDDCLIHADENLRHSYERVKFHFSLLWEKNEKRKGR